LPSAAMIALKKTPARGRWEGRRREGRGGGWGGGNASDEQRRHRGRAKVTPRSKVEGAVSICVLFLELLVHSKLTVYVYQTIYMCIIY